VIQPNGPWRHCLSAAAVAVKPIDPSGGAAERFRATLINIVKEDSVLVDHRSYRVRPGKLQQQADLYEQHGLAAQVRHLGAPIAYLQSESGELNMLVHLWGFEDAADRARKRAAMMKDPEWLNYLKVNSEAGLLVEQRNSLMVPTSFMPLKR
jgi:hypothetical protein